MTIQRDERIDASIIQAARELPTSTLHEAAGKTGALPSAIKPIARNFRLCGPAVTVACPPGDNLWIHRAIYRAQPGDVLVVRIDDDPEHGYWGEIMSTAAKVRGLDGLVIDGCVRDSDQLESLGFPVFATGLCIRGTAKRADSPGAINVQLRFRDVIVLPGDLVVGDRDGVVVVGREQAPAVIDAARKREATERQILERLVAGETTLGIFGLD